MKYSHEGLAMLATQHGGSFAQHQDNPFDFCEKLATSHYENFPVGSLLVPKRMRKHFYSIYAFARLTDDIADEHDILPEKRLAMLAELECALEFMEEKINTSMESRLGSNLSEIGDPISNPILKALWITCSVNNLPFQPFRNLLVAFRQDILFTQPQTWNDVYQYCKNSANPVGELLLRLYGYYDSDRAKYSDAICTGLQLINFWQDLSVDIARKRVYIPEQVLNDYGITSDYLLNNEKSTMFPAQFLECFRHCIEITRKEFEIGYNLLRTIPNIRLRTELALIYQGGLQMVRLTEQQGVTILIQRPKLTKFHVSLMALRAIPSLLFPRITL